MANITITIPDGQLQTVLDAVCSKYGYDVIQGQTQAQFAKDQLIGHIKNIIFEYQRAVGNKIANQQASTTVNGLNIT